MDAVPGNTQEAQVETRTPFDQSRLDRLMEDADLDFLIAASKHNVQYLLGGYKFIFFSAMDAIGHSRYLPLVIYEKGRPDNAAYIGNRLEGYEHQNRPFWTPTVHTSTWGSLDAAALAAEHFAKLGHTDARIGIEPAFLPSDAYIALRKALPEARVFDATPTFERMRALKTPDELEKLRTASELITDSMLATIAAAHEGSTKTDIIERLRREETNRGLQFEYCLLTLGSSHNRAASAQAWANGEVLSIDSGGNYHGYIGDLCRMGVLGEPDAELEDLLHEVDSIQKAAFSKITRRRAWRGDHHRGGGHAEDLAVGGLHRFLRARHGRHHPRSAVPDDQPPGHLRRRRRRPAAGGKHGDLRRDDHASSDARLHQARGYGRGHRRRLRDVRRRRPRLEPGWHGLRSGQLFACITSTGFSR